MNDVTKATPGGYGADPSYSEDMEDMDAVVSLRLQLGATGTPRPVRMLLVLRP